MTQAAGPIGAAIGGGIGFAVGGWAGARFGASVGWLVGSWVGSQFAEEKKENITPENMPKFNTAIRGAVMPVLFGTNRIAAQIAWQGGFQAIRNADSGGAGKSGGSGGTGGGKGASQSGSQAAYKYRIDAVYHLGMAPEPTALLQIWNGAAKVSDQVVRSIESTHPTNFFLIGSDQEANENTLYFDSSVFYDGSDPAISSWSVLQADVGAAISWPGTVWAGFEGLSMGTQAVLPQLSFEVGPSSVDWYYDGLNLGKSATAESNFVFAGRRPDVYGNVWMWEPSGSCRLRSFKETTGVMLTEYDLVAETADLLDTFGHGYVFNDSHSVLLNLDGTKLVYSSGIFINTAGDLFNKFVCHTATANINSNGTLTWTGGVIQEIDELYVGKSLFAIGGRGGDNDDIFISVDGGTDTYAAFLQVPSINRIEGEFVMPWNSLMGSFADTANARNWLSDFVASKWGPGPKGAIVPIYDALGVLIGNRVYHYWGKNVVAGNGHNGDVAFDNPIAMTFRTSNPNGGIVYYDMPAPGNLVVTDFGMADVVVGNPQIAGAVFKKQDNITFTYFDDDYIDLTDGVTVNDQNWYQSDPFVRRLPSGYFLVIWATDTLTDSSYTGDYRPKSNVRPFIFDASDYTFYEVARPVKISFGRMSTDYAASTNVGKVAVAHQAYRLINDRIQVYLKVNNITSDTLRNCYVWIDAGQFNPGTGKDVYPPYMIRKILTHETWGIYPGADIIDETTYATAIEYCANNQIAISAVINQQDSTIQLIQMILAVYGGWLSVDASANKIKFGVMDLANTPVRTIDNAHLVRDDDDKPPVTSTKSAGQDAFNLVRINFFDRNINYESNQIEEGDEVDQDINGIRLKEFPLKFVMSELVARKLAVRTLWSNLYGRDTHAFKLGWKDADLEPGDLITLVDSFSHLNQVVQITRMEETEHGLFNVDAQQQLQYVPGQLPSQSTSAGWDYINTGGISSYTSVASAYNFPVANGIYAIKEFTAFELPKEFEVPEAPHVYISWAGKGRPAGATLYVSADGSTYAPAKTATPYQIYGTLLTDLPNGTDFVENVNLFLAPASGHNVNSRTWDYEDTLSDVSQEAMHSGAGLIWVGSEMLSFASLTLVQQNMYRAARVYRGWGGTPVGAHSSGDTFFKQGAGIFSIPYTANQIGTNLYYKVAPFGFNGVEYPVSSIDAKQYTVQGLFYKPRIPSALQYESRRGETKFNVGSDGDMGIYWKDCGQQTGFGAGGYGQNPGGYGRYSADVTSLGYHIAVVGSGSAVVRSSYVGTPAFSYTNSQNFSDNGAWRGNVAFRVTPVNPYGLANGTSVLSLELFF